MSNRGLSSSPYKSRLEKKKKDKKRARILGGPKLRGRKAIQQKIQIESYFNDICWNPDGYLLSQNHTRKFRQMLSATPILSASAEALNGSANRQESIYETFSFYAHKNIDLRDYRKVHGRPLTTNGF